jgi:hypothetical protein
MRGIAMTPQKGKKFRTSERAERVEGMEVRHPRAAGIDVPSAVHFVAVNPADVPAGFVPNDPQLPKGVRKFGAFTCDLEALAAWLMDCHVKTIAMESTGVYWIALYELLEQQGFTVILVDPRQTKHAPGRPKSDVLDCQWIQRLHSYGLLTASFRPSADVVVWRGYQRQREMLIRYAAQHVQHMQKALEEMTSSGESGAPCGVPRPSSWLRVVRCFRPRSSNSSTGAISHDLMSPSRRPSLTRRATDFMSSA